MESTYTSRITERATKLHKFAADLDRRELFNSCRTERDANLLGVSGSLLLTNKRAPAYPRFYPTVTLQQEE